MDDHTFIAEKVIRECSLFISADYLGGRCGVVVIYHQKIFGSPPPSKSLQIIYL